MHFQVKWRKARKAIFLPELNVFPSADIFALSGYFPAIQPIGVKRVRFDIRSMEIGIEGDYSVTIPPTIPGLEYTLPTSRLHFTLPDEDA